MRYLIMSDIHGSSFYLNKVLENAKGRYDKIIILGDVLYHGPRNDLPYGYAPKECIAILNPLKDIITCVRGNCDAEVDQMVLSFLIQDSYYFNHNNKTIYCSHGHHLDFDNLKSYKADICLYGHFHIPCIEQKDGVLLVNPSSISIPKSNEGGCFIILDEKGFHLFNLENKEIKTYLF